MKAPPPSKELCLLMAKITYPRDEKLSWTWLFAWGRTKRGPGLFVVADESMRLDELIVSTKDLARVLNHWR